MVLANKSQCDLFWPIMVDWYMRTSWWLIWVDCWRREGKGKGELVWGGGGMRKGEGGREEQESYRI